MEITVERLRALGARCEELRAFEREWPDGAAVTRENVLRAVELRLDMEWFARRLLPESQAAEYRRQVAPLRAEYKRQQEPLWAEHWRQRTPLSEYERQRLPLRIAFEQQCALLFWRLSKLAEKGGSDVEVCG